MGEDHVVALLDHPLHDLSVTLRVLPQPLGVSYVKHGGAATDEVRNHHLYA